MKVRCIDTKTGRIFHTSKAVTENAAFMRKYGYQVQDMRAATIPAGLPATEPEELTTDPVSENLTPTTPITKVSAPAKPKNKGGRTKRKPSK